MIFGNRYRMPLQLVSILKRKQDVFRTTFSNKNATSATSAPLAFSQICIHQSSQRPHWFSSKTTKHDTSGKPDFVVSILGPPNAGKSTLFNRLQCKERNRTYKLGSNRRTKGKQGGKKKSGIKGRISSNRISEGGAIVSHIPGTTRDRRECWGRIGGTDFTLMDTAGIDGEIIQVLSPKSREASVRHAMMEQTLQAALLSDLVLLLWDARVGVTQDLMTTARWLRKLGNLSKVVVVANKLEGDSWAQDEDSIVMENLRDVLRLGLGNAIPISALQGDGLGDIATLIEERKAEKYNEPVDKNTESNFKKISLDKTKDCKPLQIAIIGRQNVGKSSLINAIVEHDRVLAGSTPGLTRDAIAIEWYWEGIFVQLVDTAGIRKLTRRTNDAVEDMAVADALRAMKVAEVAVLVLDAEELYINRQELAICNAVLNEGRSLVIAANKMDLLELSNEYSPQDFANSVREQIESRIPLLRNVPVLPMSCISGQGVSNLLPTAVDARKRWSQVISTGLLNRWLREVVTGARVPIVEGVRAKLKYIIQTKGRPPTFIIYSNVNQIPESYLRYLTKHFQDSFKFFGMPIRLVIKNSSRSNPYSERKKKKRVGFGLGGRNARLRRRVKEIHSQCNRSKKRVIHTMS